MTPPDRPPTSGYPLGGLRWGLLLGVVAALALFAVVLVVETDRSSDGSGQPAAGPTTPGSAAAPPSTAAPTTVPASAPAASATSASGSGSAAPGDGTILTGSTLATGWETKGWSWDSTVAPGTGGPDGRAAYAVTYAKPFGGFALRRGVTGRPAASAVLRVRVYTDGPALKVGLQVQSSDDGLLGALVVRDVPSRKWVTVTATMPELRVPSGVRRVSVVAQGVPAGTRLWVSEVTLR